MVQIHWNPDTPLPTPAAVQQGPNFAPLEGEKADKCFAPTLISQEVVVKRLRELLSVLVQLFFQSRFRDAA